MPTHINETLKHENAQLQNKHPISYD